MEASIDFDEERFENILRTAENALGYEALVLKVLFPLLNKIGMLWLTGRVIPAHEHFASSFITNQMIVAIDKLPLPAADNSRKVLLFAPKNEFHEIPLLFMWYLLRKNNVPVVYLGVNTSTEIILQYTSRQTVSELYCYVMTNLVNCNIDKFVGELSAKLPDKSIYFGGSQTCKLSRHFDNVKVLKTAEEIMGFIASRQPEAIEQAAQ
jgi:hypothetical protein